MSNSELLQAKIKMYLKSGAGDPQSIELLKESYRAMKYSWDNEKLDRVMDRLDLIVAVLERIYNRDKV